MYKTKKLSIVHKILIYTTYSMLITMGAYVFLSILEGGLWQYMTLNYGFSILILFGVSLILSFIIVTRDLNKRVMYTLETEKKRLLFDNGQKKYDIESSQLFKVSLHHLFYILTPYRKIYFYFKGVKQTFVISLLIPKNEAKNTLESIQKFYHLNTK